MKESVYQSTLNHFFFSLYIKRSSFTVFDNSAKEKKGIDDLAIVGKVAQTYKALYTGTKKPF